MPSPEEIKNCASWLADEIRLLKPKLILPVGKLAISQFMPIAKLDEIVGEKYLSVLQEVKTDIIPLPHPSGASTWHRTEPGVKLLRKALQHIKSHAAWRRLIKQCNY